MPANSLTETQRQALGDLLAGRTQFFVYSSTLGWTAKPNGRTPLYRANSEGIRGEREYTLAPKEGVLRIATFGDSFMYGADVKCEDSWQEAMMRDHRSLEVLNFGVAGFGTDQAFLRYHQEGTAYRPDIVIIGFFSDNISRNVNVYRAFYTASTDIPLAKPRYVMEDNRLVLVPNPMGGGLPQYAALLADPARVLPVLGQHDYFYQTTYHPQRLAVLPSVRLYQIARIQLQQRAATAGIEKNGYYNVDSEAFRVTAAIFDRFIDAVQKANSVPVIVAMPGQWDIGRYRRDGTKVYEPLLQHFRTRGYRYLDMLDGFEQYGKAMTAVELAPGHYSPAGNRLVARALWQFLERNHLVDPKTLRSH